MSHDVIPVDITKALEPLPQFNLKRWEWGEYRMREDPDGQWVSLQDGRRTFNAMQSQLVSAGLGPMTPREVRQAHQHRGDNARIWMIIGGGMNPNEDIFQRIEKMVNNGLVQAAQIRDLKALVEMLRGELKQRLPPPPPALPEPAA